MKRVIIVGGGISGLSTAFYLSRARPDLGIVLLEGRSRLGGVITTFRRDGFVIEGGPDSFVTAKPWGVQLCRDLGIESRLIPTNPAHRKTYVLSRGRWGKGFATEAATAVRDRALGELGLTRLIALIAHGNEASKKVARKLGMAYERDAEFQGRVVELYALEV